MVSTRYSRSDDSQPFMSTRNSLWRKGSTSRALRKLEIDGNDSLKGGRDGRSKSQDPVKVYHWRGAVYAVDENTPEEWIEAQPKRYLKRKREDEGEGVSDVVAQKIIVKQDDRADDDDESESDEPVDTEDVADWCFTDEDEDEDEEEEDDEEEEEEDDDEEDRPRTRRAVGRPVRVRVTSRRAQSMRRSTITKNSPTSIRKKQALSSLARPPTPQSLRRRRGRPPTRSDPRSQTTRGRYTRRAPAHLKTPRSRQVAKPPAQSLQPSGQIAIEPISWADMMTGRIAISLTRFLAVQKQLRKLQHEYALARDLHARVLAREVARKSTAYHDRSPIIVDAQEPSIHLEAGATVQRTDSRLGRREGDISDTKAGAPRSEDGNRDRASSFDTAPSHADLTSPKMLSSSTALSHVDSTPPKMHVSSSTPLQPRQESSRTTHGGITVHDLVQDNGRAEHMLLTEKLAGKETPEEKSERFSREWDQMMTWPRYAPI